MKLAVLSMFFVLALSGLVQGYDYYSPDQHPCFGRPIETERIPDVYYMQESVPSNRCTDCNVNVKPLLVEEWDPEVVYVQQDVSRCDSCSRRWNFGMFTRIF